MKILQDVRMRAVAADTCILSLKTCPTLDALKSVHAVMLQSGLTLNIFFSTALLSRYAAVGSIHHAYAVFSSISAAATDVFLVNAMLQSFVDCARFDGSLLLYRRMRRSGITTPDHFSFPCLVKAAGCFGDFALASSIHREVIRFGCASHVLVCNSIIAMYGRCGRTELARALFDEMPHSRRSAVTWSCMIGAYAQNGFNQLGILLFRHMMGRGIGVSRSALLNVMPCVSTESDAQSIFRLVVASGHGSHQAVQNAAMRMFGRIDRIDIARSIFLQIVDKDLFSWSSMIEAYAQSDSPFDAFQHFIEMTLLGFRPDSVTLLSLVRACCTMRSVQQAHLVHGIILRTLSSYNVSLGTALVDLYVNCGSIRHARSVFDRMQERNARTWSTMISGYGIHGHGKEALRLYDQMRRNRENPDHITLVAVLSACSHAGLIAEGWECFESMERDFGITPGLEHYACMVDLLGRAGQLDEARNFVEGMPIEPGVGVWGSLLGACRIHSNLELAEHAAKALLELDGCNPGRYVLLSHIYSSTGKQAEAEKIRKLMTERGLKKFVGHTSIHS
uniref:Pentatricopeptide repeat-containing protein n=1 Tax=Kalanchoe fedtschenkoi TaxID=63787 RepID=A0A7N0TKS6_KALFE